MMSDTVSRASRLIALMDGAELQCVERTVEARREAITALARANTQEPKQPAKPKATTKTAKGGRL